MNLEDNLFQFYLSILIVIFYHINIFIHLLIIFLFQIILFLILHFRIIQILQFVLYIRNFSLFHQFVHTNKIIFNK